MAELDPDQEIAIMLRVPRKLFVMVAPPPATVTQRTVTQHFGIPPRAYLDLVRGGRIAAKKLGKLQVAAYEDVRRVLTEGAELRSRIQRAVEPAAKQPPPPDPEELVETALRYIQSGKTPKEVKQRRKEIGDQGMDMMVRYDATLEDGSANPEANQALHDQGMDLFDASLGMKRIKKASDYAEMKCESCHRSAYATKQTWTINPVDKKGFWCGAHVCQVCAKIRAPNQRVVQYPGPKVLFPARDPKIPPEP